MKKLIFVMSITGLAFALCGFENFDSVKDELIDIWKEDQDIRRSYGDAWEKYGRGSVQVDSLGKVMHQKDSLHVLRVTQILDQHGWLGKDQIGKLANNTLFVVIQHADIRTQEKYLPMMRQAVKDGKSDPGWLALLEDRVALRSGKRQIYGSQVFMNPNTNAYYVAPLEDPDNVDKRRSEVGLDKMAHYLKDWKIKWDVEEYKKELPEIEKLKVE